MQPSSALLFVQPFTEKANKRPQRLPAMADAVFLFHGHFGERLRVPFRHEERVVAEAATAPLFFQNPPGTDALEQMERAGIRREGQYRPEAGPAVLDTFQALQEQRPVVGVGSRR